MDSVHIFLVLDDERRKSVYIVGEFQIPPGRIKFNNRRREKVQCYLVSVLAVSTPGTTTVPLNT